jgi:hypothetical protein
VRVGGFKKLTSEGYIYDWRFSPDGKWLATASTLVAPPLKYSIVYRSGVEETGSVIPGWTVEDHGTKPQAL